MGVDDLSPLLRPNKQYTTSLKEIRRKHPVDDEKQLILVGIDVSIFIVRAIKTKDALDEMFLEPKVPCQAVAKYVLAYVRLLRKHNLEPILFFDGNRLPPGIVVYWWNKYETYFYKKNMS